MSQSRRLSWGNYRVKRRVYRVLRFKNTKLATSDLAELSRLVMRRFRSMTEVDVVRHGHAAGPSGIKPSPS